LSPKVERKRRERDKTTEVDPIFKTQTKAKLLVEVQLLDRRS
jgi:hypothetical protein